MPFQIAQVTPYVFHMLTHGQARCFDILLQNRLDNAAVVLHCRLYS